MRLLTTLPHTGSPRAPKRFNYFNIPVEHFDTDSGAQNHGGPLKRVLQLKQIIYLSLFYLKGFKIKTEGGKWNPNQLIWIL